MIPPEIGKAIRAARLSHGWTQKKLARRVGMVQPKLSRIERGQQRCTLLELIDIAEMLRIDPVELFQDVLRSLKP